MSYHYIALVEREGFGSDNADPVADARLRSLGMHASAILGPAKLYVSNETPVLPLPNGGFVIGHLFSRSGALFGNAPEFQTLSHAAPLGGYLLEHCWGEYLLIEPTFDDERSWKVTRDPSGGVSCVHSLRNDAGFFTSDISLAVHLGRYAPKIDWDYIAYCLVYPNKTGRTGLVDVCELLPGCSLCVRDAGVTTKLDWSPWSIVVRTPRHIDPNEAAMEVRRTVEYVVKTWAEADKSILLELSGGLDSSILAAALKDAQAHVACCTLMTPVPGADERLYARLMTDKLGLPLDATEIRFEDARFDFTVPPDSVAPGISALQYATNAVKERIGERLGITSYFSGAGGDTIFCSLNNAAPAADAFRQLGVSAGLSAIRDLSELHQCTLWKAARLALRKLRRPPKAPCKPDTTFLNSSTIAIDRVDHPWFVAPEGALDGDRDRIFDLANTQSFKDGAARSMRRVLRYPLLSQPVIEACLRAPSWMWISRGRNRAVARYAFADVLPQQIVDRRSKGTYMNYSGALYRKTKHQMLDYLLTGRLQSRGLLDTAALQRFVAAELPARDRSFMRIFDLCAVENWVRQQP
jgi:asparagine synthase (glutamine-hydrolysing)